MYLLELHCHTAQNLNRIYTELGLCNVINKEITWLLLCLAVERPQLALVVLISETEALDAHRLPFTADYLTTIYNVYTAYLMIMLPTCFAYLKTTHTSLLCYLRDALMWCSPNFH